MPLTVDELRTIAADGLVEVGSHTVTHPVLALLKREEQQREIAGGKEALEELLDLPVVSFSYPYGGPADYTGESVELVRRAGFARACANVPGLVGVESDRFQLPRLIVRDWDGDRFARRLEAWFADESQARRAEAA
jgi:peptidoglycan/xylan/chitin deacetylase (PgdA/CDA1 family)